MAIGGWTPTYTKEVTGNWYIDLTDAVVNKLLELKAYWWCVQASTPTPTTPVDIKCNNGALKVRHQSGLPLGYTQLTYIQSDGRQVINTGYVLQETDSVEVDYKLTDLTRTGDKFILGAQPVSDTSIGGFWVETYNSSNIWYIRYGSSASANTYGSVTPTSQLSGTLAISKNSFVVNGVKILTPDFVSMPVNPMTIFNRISLDGSIPNNGASAQISEVRVKNGNNIVHKYIPVRNSNNELGMYDLVSGQFFTNQGTGDFVAGDPVNDLEIYTDGTVETINAHGKNLFDVVNVPEEFIANLTYTRSVGQLNITVNGGYARLKLELPQLVVGEEYTFSFNSDTTGIGNIRIVSDTGSGYSDTLANKKITIGDNSVSFTATYKTLYVFWYPRTSDFTEQFSYIISDIQLELGSTATTYEPYYNGGTATCEDLLWVWDYKDEQEILSGNVVVKCGVIVFDGVNTWAKVTAVNANEGKYYAVCGGQTNAVATTTNLLSTHFKAGAFSSGYDIVYTVATNLVLVSSDQSLTTVNSYNQWLADQLSAWTPVIVVYPLATPKTLSVAWQSLSIPAWDSRIEIVEWSILNLPLYAKYKSTTE